ncbi:MAG: hypothetical protein ACJ8DI_30980 [Ktedonobacteraceae bacterium]
MAQAPVKLAGRRLKTPRAAAIAGILFAVLYSMALVLIRLSIPTDASDRGAWLAGQSGTVSLALVLAPLAGIAFLWFIGVLRDRMAQLEDQFFSTVFLGSGLLYLGLSFMSAALAGGLLAGYAADPGLVKSDVYFFARQVMYQINNVYALRMSSVFMISLATIWLRTGTAPRVLVVLTYMLALGLLFSASLSFWLTFTFPLWVLAISVFIQVENLRNPAPHAERSPETA